MKRVVRGSIDSHSRSLVLYHGYPKSSQRYNDLVSGFDTNRREVDLADDIDVALGYGPCLVKVVIDPGLRFNVRHGVSKADIESDIQAGYDGIIQGNQYYIFNIAKLNSLISSITAISKVGGEYVDVDVVGPKQPLEYLGDDFVFAKGVLFSQDSEYFDVNEYVLCHVWKSPRDYDRYYVSADYESGWNMKPPYGLRLGTYFHVEPHKGFPMEYLYKYDEVKR